MNRFRRQTKLNKVPRIASEEELAGAKAYWRGIGKSFPKQGQRRLHKSIRPLYGIK